MRAPVAPRVIHVSQPVDAGVAHVLAALLEDQAAAGWSVRLICPAGWLSERAADLGVPWSRWDAGRSPGPAVPREVRQLARLLAEAPADLVHLHSSKAGLTGRLALRGRRPTVFQPHAWSFSAVGGPTATAALAWERAATRWTDLQLCCSAEEQRIGRQRGIGGRSQVVPNGVDLARFAVAGPQERQHARARLGLSDDVPVAVCVGRLSAQKGQDVALRAWPTVRAQLPGATLLLVGEGPDRAALETGSGPGVRLLGHRDDVADVLAAADLALLPSRWEGLALALLEAMARGLPVVTTEVGGSRSTLLEGGLPPAGAVVPVDDPAALARAVGVRLASPDLARGEGAAGRSRIERDHDLRRTSAALREVCASLLV